MQERNGSGDYGAVAYFSRKAHHFGLHYERSPAFWERQSVWRSLLDKYASPGQSAIDMGCGTGVFSFYLAAKGIKVIGIDAAAGMIEVCEREKARLSLKNTTFIQAELPLLQDVPLKKVDMIICSSVLEYVEDIDGTLTKFTSLMSETGVLILSMPNILCFNRHYQRMKFKITGQPEVYRYIRRMTSPGQISHWLEPFGFDIREVHYYDHEARVSKMARAISLPRWLTGDLFVAVFGRNSSPR